MRDDDLSIPVLADILEPGDPAKADPAVPRRPMGHAWTDALVREARAEPLAAVPMLSDVLMPGDPARARQAPHPAETGLTIPLLTEVLSYHDASADRPHDESSGAPIPMLTDVIADYDEGQAEAQAQAEARAEAESEAVVPSAKPFAFEVDDLPVLTDVFADEAEPEPLETTAGTPATIHAPMDLSALASSIEANLLDSELPFRAYCAFPGESPLTAIDAGDSAVPPSWPMATVPQPFGSGEPEAREPEAPAEESAAPATFVHDPASLRCVIAPESSDAHAVSAHPVPFEPIATETLPEAEEPAPAIAVDEADHVAAMLSHPEPIAAELTQPQPEYLSELAIVPAQVEIEHVAAAVRDRALRYLASEGHTLIESRCQEQAVWLAHRITREIATTLEREIGQWVQDALNDALEKRLPPR